MSILRDFEKRLEGAVEGFFARAFRSGLQPVELAKAIQRYEADYQHVGVDAVYVPNVYRFTLSQSDIERFSGFTRSLQRELADVARRTADEKGWRTQGPIRIEFERSDDIRVGTFELRGKSEAPGTGAPSSSRQGPPPMPASPPTAQPAPRPPAAEPAVSTAAPAGPAARPVLRAVDGADAGKVFPVEHSQVVLGRLPECDITLTGAGVSRRHAKLQQEGDRWTITDLGSTNGVRVNAQPVQVSEVKPGDRLEVGDVTFTFLLSGQ
ncbi:FhaA domain-containing protein [Euzebya sp.]|uniref:FhaA domain-containing protein n=1 Tax=Euzebya sp. TaxID=1971409 RepID=UPI0035117330